MNCTINIKDLRNENLDMNDIIQKSKITKAMSIICRLFDKNQITDAYIVGSIAKGDIKKESDIDIIVINPILNPYNPISADLPPFKLLSSRPNEDEKRAEELRMQIVDTLKNDIGMEFKELHRKDDVPFWYQLYNDDIFHIMTARNKEFIKNGIEINRSQCGRKYDCHGGYIHTSDVYNMKYSSIEDMERVLK